MMRRYAALAVLPAFFALACNHSDSPSSSQTASTSASLAPLQVNALAAAAQVNVPSGSMTMSLSITVDEDKHPTAAVATFVGNFTNFQAASSLTAATVNSGAVGVNGPVVIDLSIPASQVNFDANGNATMSATVGVDPNVASQIAANPTLYYFLVSTPLFPNGLLRGQFR
jgi:CHRD domain-containing protein